MADGRESDSVCGTEAGSDASVVDAGDAVDTETQSHARGASGADRSTRLPAPLAVGDACEAFYKDGLWVPAKVLGATPKGAKLDVRYDKPEPPIDCRSIYYPMKDDSLGAIANRVRVRRVEILMEANRELFTARLGTTAPKNVMVHKLTKLIIPHVHIARGGQTPQVVAPRVVAPRAPHTLPHQVSAESQPVPRRPSRRFTCPRASWARRSTRHGSRRS